MNLDEIIQQVAAYSTKYITVTGGEPLAQKNCLTLLSSLCDKGYQVSLETSGALDISGIDQRVSRVMDIKTPASGEVAKNCFENINYLRPEDQIKFVICDHEDYLWAREIMQQHSLVDRCEVIFSPSMGQIESHTLADWIINDQLPVRFQLQLHKVLWGNEPGR